MEETLTAQEQFPQGPGPKDKAKKLYANLSSLGFTVDNLGKEDEFINAISDSNTAVKIYNNLISSGLSVDNLGSQDEFTSTFSEKKNGGVSVGTVSSPTPSPSQLPSEGEPVSKIDLTGSIVRSKDGRLLKVSKVNKNYLTVEDTKKPGVAFDIANQDIDLTPRRLREIETVAPADDNAIINALNKKAEIKEKYSEAMGKESMVEANRLQQDISEYDRQLRTFGIKEEDEKKLIDDFKTISPELLQEGMANTKDTLLRQYKENPQAYEQNTAYLKLVGDWNKATQEYGKPPSEYIKEKGFYAPEEIPVGEFDINLSTPDQIRITADKIRKYGGEKTDELLKNLSIATANTYGNLDLDIFKGDPRKSVLNDNQLLALKYLEDTNPDSAQGYGSLIVNPEELKNNPAAQSGWEEKASSLEQIGLTLRKNAKERALNDVKKKALEGTITEEEIQLGNDLENEVNSINEDLSNIKIKYKTPANIEAQKAAMEITDNYISGPINRAFMSLGDAGDKTISGIVDFILEPFRSEESSRVNQLESAGLSAWNEVPMMVPKEAQAMQTSVLKISPELKQKIDIINNDKSIDKDEKTRKVYELLRKNPNEFGYVPLSKSKININPASLWYSVVDLGATIVPYLALESVTAGGATAGIIRKLTSSFIAAAATSFHDNYVAAIRENDPNPFGHALRTTAITSAFMAGAGTPQLIKNMLGAKTAIGEMVSKMTDKEIQTILDKAKKTFSYEKLGKALKGSAWEGFKGGAKFEIIMTAPKIINRKLDNKDIDYEELAKEAALGVLNFTLFGTISGSFKQYKKIDELQATSLLKASENPAAFMLAAQKKLKDGNITQEDYQQIIQNIELAASASAGVKYVDNKGMPLSVKKKAELLVLKMQEAKLKEDAEGAPTELKKEINTQLKEVGNEIETVHKPEEEPKKEEKEKPKEEEVKPAEEVVSEEVKPVEKKAKMKESLKVAIEGEEKPVQTYTKENVKDIDESQYKGDKNKTNIVKNIKKIISAIDKLVKTTTGKELSVNLHDSKKTYEEAVVEAGGSKQDATSKGFYLSTNGSIHINMDRATAETIKHEAFHPILDYLASKNSDIINDLHSQLSKLKGGQEIINRANKTYANYSEVQKKKEAITDFVAKVADGTFKIDQSNFQAVKDYVVKMLTKIGLYTGEPIDNITDLVDLAKNISAKFAAGKEVKFAETKSKDLSKNIYVGQEKSQSQFQKGDELKPEEIDYKSASKIIKENNQRIKNKNPEAIVPEPQIDKKTGQAKLIVTEGDEPGTRDVEVLYKNVPYNLENGALKYISKNREKALEMVSDKMVSDYKENINRPEISAALGWYGNMRLWFQKNFGANIELFGQLLAATSARTEVVDNFKQAVDALRNLAKGRYNDLLADYDKFVKNIEAMSNEALFDKWREKNPNKRPSEFNADYYRRYLINQYENVPLRSNGKKFNANSKKVLQALYGNWLTQTEGPKTKNFAGNLTGRSFEATIDVWAARYLRRIIYGDKLSKWRILPQSEGGVDFSILKSGEMSGDYPFAEEVMRRAAKKLGINADDLQAFLWYLEKDVWDKNNWTNITGKRKASFEDAAKSIDSDRYQLGVTTFKDMPTFDKERFEEERKAIEAEIAKIPGIIAARVTASEGEFVSTEDIFIEPTFDVEFTVEKGQDITNVINKVDEIQAKYNQDATIVSRYTDSENPNARPIIEVGLASPVENSEIIQDIKNTLVQNNVRGFTISRDRQGRILGFRSQFIPEFESEATMQDGIKRFEKAFNEIKTKYGKNKNISYIASGYVDSRIKFKEDGAKEEKLDGGTYGEKPIMEGELPSREREKGTGILPEEKRREDESKRGGANDGLAGEPKISTKEIKKGEEPQFAKEEDLTPENEFKIFRWIEEQRKSGETDADIKEVLADYGYSNKQISSLMEGKSITTGIKIAKTEEERLARGLQPIEVAMKRGYGDVLDQAKSKVGTGEIQPKLLAAEISLKPRALSAEEGVALMLDRMSIMKELARQNDIYDKAIKEGNDIKAEVIQTQIEVLRQELELNDRASRLSGYESGIALGIRRMLINQDYSYESQLLRLKNANKGKDIPVEYKNRLKDLTNQLKEANDKLDKYEKAEALKKEQAEIAKIKATEEGKAEVKAKAKTIKDKIVEVYKKSIAAIKAKQEGKQQLSKEEEELSPEKIEALSAITPLVRDMVKMYAESGVTDLKQIIQNIHKDLSVELEDLTISDLENVITNKYKKAKEKPVLTAEQITAKANIEKVKDQIDKLKDEIEVRTRTKGERVRDYFHGWHRFSILSGIPSIGKISMAALSRGAVSRVENVIALALSKIPGISYIAKRAPREGGINAKAEAKAFATWFDKNTRDDFKNVMDTGLSELDYLYGNKKEYADRVPAWMEFFGKMHGALKLLPKRAEFFRSLEMRTEYAITHGENIEDPMVQEKLAVAAYNDATRAIFMQENPVTDAYNSAVSHLEKKSPNFASTLRLLFPIVKVPTNYVFEESSYMIGALKAAYALRKGVKNLTPEQADYFMRALKKQSIGLAFMFLGYCNPDVFGGYYTGKRKKDDLEAGDIELFGMSVPHWMTHTPLLEMLQVGATIRRAEEKAEKKGEEIKPTTGISDVFKGQLAQVPFYGGAERIMKAVDGQDVNNFGKWAFSTIESVTTPQLIQNIADWTDTREGEMLKRTPDGFLEQLMSGIPGLRQMVPEKIEGYNKKELEVFDFITNRGVEIPDFGKKERYKIITDEAHPDGVMTNEEYEQFINIVKKKTMQEFNAILDNNYKIKDKKEVKTVKGRDLSREDLQTIIESIHNKAIEEAKKELGLLPAKKERKIEKIK